MIWKQIRHIEMENQVKQTSVNQGENEKIDERRQIEK